LPSTDLNLVSVRPRVRVDGSDDAALGEAASALSVHLPATGMASAELRVINWHPGEGGAGQPDFAFQGLRLGSRIEIRLGESAANAVFAGDITAFEERYGDGAPQLVILAEDALHKLARSRASRVFENKGLADVVRDIAGDAGLQADVNVDAGTANWLQHNESHLAFLLRLLVPHAIALRMQGGRLRARPEEADANPVRLDPGANAQRIRIVADLNRQPREALCDGYNLDANSSASGSHAALAPTPAGRTAAATLAELGWDGRSPRPHPFARTQSEAESLAKGAFLRDAQRFLHGEIVCTGMPELGAGREVELAGVSSRLAGRYRVAECWHHFDNAQGLHTRLRVERPDWNP
jgi:phage protein D